jgi:VanZ family protein
MFWRKALTYKEAVIVGLVILYASLIREPHIRLHDVPLADKWGHLLAYAVLGGMLAWDMIRDQRRWLWVWVTGLTLPIVYGGVIELLQGAFFYPRTADWMDWVADIIGTVTGTGLVAGICQAKS